MPVSWKSTLQQYAGRLLRQQAGKTSVCLTTVIGAQFSGHPAVQIQGFRDGALRGRRRRVAMFLAAGDIRLLT
jgi:hypothetical protein